MEVVVKEELEEPEHLAPLDCIVARIKKEIEEDFAINEALLYDEDTSGDEEVFLQPLQLCGLESVARSKQILRIKDFLSSLQTPSRK